MNNVVELPKIDKNTIKCASCGIRQAKWLCDYETGVVFSRENIRKAYCSKPLCDKCTTKINNKDFCKEHIKVLKKELLNG